MQLPPGWRSREVHFEPAPSRGISPRRIVVFGRRVDAKTADGPLLLVGVALLPESLVADIGPALSAALASARPAGD